MRSLPASSPTAEHVGEVGRALGLGELNSGLPGSVGRELRAGREQQPRDRHAALRGRGRERGGRVEGRVSLLVDRVDRHPRGEQRARRPLGVPTAAACSAVPPVCRPRRARPRPWRAAAPRARRGCGTRRRSARRHPRPVRRPALRRRATAMRSPSGRSALRRTAASFRSRCGRWDSRLRRGAASRRPGSRSTRDEGGEAPRVRRVDVARRSSEGPGDGLTVARLRRGVQRRRRARASVRGIRRKRRTPRDRVGRCAGTHDRGRAGGRSRCRRRRRRGRGDGG